MSTAEYDPKMSYSGAPSELECEALVRQLLEEGQFFLAYDRGQSALKQYPGNVQLKQMCARCLIQAGALNEARAILESLTHVTHSDDPLLMRFYVDLHNMMTEVGDEGRNKKPSPQSLVTLVRLLNELRLTIGSQISEANLNEETQGLLGSLYKSIWKRTKRHEDAVRCRDAYMLSFTANGGKWSGINVAAMSWLLGEHELAAIVAREVLNLCLKPPHGPDTDDPYWIQVTIGEAHLYLGEAQEALRAYRKAVALAGKRHTWIISSLRQLKILQEHDFPLPPEIFEILKPPTVVVFVGHMVDQKDRSEPRFPAALEGRVREEIDKKLEELNPQFGYCSAACGSDLIFIEAMLDRGAEVTILLPFATEDFIHNCVEFAGPSWVRRFRSALHLASSVKHITTEPLLGDSSLFEFLGQMFQGYAYQHARTLETEPYLLTVWDGNPVGPPGGTADLVSAWPDHDRLHHIDTRQLLKEWRQEQSGDKVVHTYSVLSGSELRKSELEIGRNARQIKTMMFADIVGYSKMREEDVPFFMHRFLQYIADNLPMGLPFVNTWGDAIYVVMDHAIPLAEYALKLRDLVCETNWWDPRFAQGPEAEAVGYGMMEQESLSLENLPGAISVRIALHTGPVYEATDPLTQRRNYYGAHVNRAARMEPVTIPGHIYASEQFAGMLISEQIAAKQGWGKQGSAGTSDVVCDPIGTLTLAKRFGTQVAYHLHRI